MNSVFCIFVECYPDDSGHGPMLESIWTTEELAKTHLPQSGYSLRYYIQEMRINTEFPHVTEQEEQDLNQLTSTWDNERKSGAV